MKKCFILAALMISGCASDNMEAAKESYIACVKKTPDGCKSERLAYEAEMASYNARARAAAN